MTKTRVLKPVDAPNYGYLQALYMSFYSRQLYADVGLRWPGLGLIYMLVLMSIICIPVSINFVSKINRYYNEQIIPPLESIPQIIVQNGKAIFDKPMPYFVKNKDNQVIVVVDTTGKIKNIPSEYPDLRVLFLKDKIIYRQPKIEFFKENEGLADSYTIKEQVFSQNENIVIDGRELVDITSLMKLKVIFIIMAYPCVVSFMFTMFSLMFLAFSVLGKFFSRALFKFVISSKQSARITMVASTPTIIILFIIYSLGWVPPGGAILYTSLLAFYFSLAVISIKGVSKKLVR